MFIALSVRFVWRGPQETTAAIFRLLALLKLRHVECLFSTCLYLRFDLLQIVRFLDSLCNLDDVAFDNGGFDFWLLLEPADHNWCPVALIGRFSLLHYLLKLRHLILTGCRLFCLTPTAILYLFLVSYIGWTGGMLVVCLWAIWLTGYTVFSRLNLELTEADREESTESLIITLEKYHYPSLIFTKNNLTVSRKLIPSRSFRVSWTCSSVSHISISYSLSVRMPRARNTNTWLPKLIIRSNSWNTCCTSRVPTKLKNSHLNTNFTADNPRSKRCKWTSLRYFLSKS